MISFNDIINSFSDAFQGLGTAMSKQPMLAPLTKITSKHVFITLASLTALSCINFKKVNESFQNSKLAERFQNLKFSFLGSKDVEGDKTKTVATKILATNAKTHPTPSKQTPPPKKAKTKRV